MKTAIRIRKRLKGENQRERTERQRDGEIKRRG